MADQPFRQEQFARALQAWWILRALLVGGFCGAVLLGALVWAYPTARETLHVSTVAFISFIVSSPLLLLAWALTPGPGRRAASYPWVRKALVLQLGLSGVAVFSFWVPSVGMILFLTGVLAFAVGFPVLAALPMREGEAESLRHLRRGLLALAAVPVFLCLALNWGHAALVGARADHIAAGRAYCLMVEGPESSNWPYRSGDRYREVKNIHDLTWLSMRAATHPGSGSMSFRLAFHGLLVVELVGGHDYFNWSRASLGFDPVSDEAQRELRLFRSATCEPRVEFGRRLIGPY